MRTECRYGWLGRLVKPECEAGCHSSGCGGLQPCQHDGQIGITRWDSWAESSTAVIAGIDRMIHRKGLVYRCKQQLWADNRNKIWWTKDGILRHRRPQYFASRTCATVPLHLAAQPYWRYSKSIIAQHPATSITTWRPHTTLMHCSITTTIAQTVVKNAPGDRTPHTTRQRQWSGLMPGVKKTNTTTSYMQK